MTHDPDNSRIRAVLFIAILFAIVILVAVFGG